MVVTGEAADSSVFQRRGETLGALGCCDGDRRKVLWRYAKKRQDLVLLSLR